TAANRPAPRAAEQQSARSLVAAPDVRGDHPDLGRLVDRRLWRLSLGADDCCAAAQRAGAKGGGVFRLRRRRRGDRQDRCHADRPLIGRRPLGVIWGLGGTAALALAGYYHSVFVSGVPLIVVLMCASTFCIEGGFSNLA